MFSTFEYIGTQTLRRMIISRPTCIGSTIEASNVRKTRKCFVFKNFILPHCIDSATPPKPNERDPNNAQKREKGKKWEREEKGEINMDQIA